MINHSITVLILIVIVTHTDTISMLSETTQPSKLVKHLDLFIITGSFCQGEEMLYNDQVDNDCDFRIDEELLNGVDDDGDGRIDEDIATNKHYSDLRVSGLISFNQNDYAMSV